MSKRFPLVSVVTPTKNRRTLLTRAMRSVASQTGVATEHIVIGDDCPVIHASAGELLAEFPTARFVNVTRETHPAMPHEYLPGRVAFLRNLGITASSGTYIAHLDDDNEYEPEHLRSLVDTLDENPGAEVAHSWRRLLQRDGTPFTIGTEDPWYPFPAGRAQSFKLLASCGILHFGSSVVRDSIVTGPDGRLVARIDSSELLALRSLHERIPFPTAFSPLQRIFEATEDVNLCLALVRRGARVVCSKKPTLRYYMGGYSNVTGDSGGGG